MMLKTIVMMLASAVWIAGCSGAPPASPDPGLQHMADLYGIQQIEVKFHEAISKKDLDLMLSLYADNATLTAGGQTYVGKEGVRTFFSTKSTAFLPENNWISETPAYKLRSTVSGDVGTLYFECHFVDPESKMVMLVAGQDQSVARMNGEWLITTQSASSLPELEP